MQKPLAYLNGQLVPAADLSISIYDAGFVQGVTVAEQLRTFGGRTFRADEHWRRLARSLEIVGIQSPVSQSQFEKILRDVVEPNHAQLDPADDLGVAFWIAPGPYGKYADFAPSGPTVCCHAQPLDFQNWSHLYAAGQLLVTATTRKVSPQNWPVELKCRSRMHYYLADKEAREVDSQARALLLDLDGHVCEASTANLLAVEDGKLVSPRLEKILPGVSLLTIRELAEESSVPFEFRDMLPAELAAANEILLCSTSPCLWPVTSLDGRPIGAGQPGPMFQRLMAAFSDRVGVDIVEQAQRFAERR